MIDFRGPLSPEREALVNTNLGLVDWAIRRWFPDSRRLGLYDDDWQAGWTGLARSTFDWDRRRSNLSTYAATWMRKAIEAGRVHEGLKDWHGNERPRLVSLETEWRQPDTPPLRLGDMVTARNRIWRDVFAEEGSGLTDVEQAKIDAARAAALPRDLPVLELIGSGHSIKRASIELGRCDSYSQKRIARLRQRIA